MGVKMRRRLPNPQSRHCEERSDEAIHTKPYRRAKATLVAAHGIVVLGDSNGKLQEGKTQKQKAAAYIY
jgi:hypothetical protein